MNQENQIYIKRKKDVLHQTGYSNSVLHSRIKNQLFIPPISLGGERCVGWISSEIDTVLAAYTAGKTKAEIKILVLDLIAKRKTALEDIA